MDCTECNILTCVLYVIDKCEYFVYFIMLPMLNFNKKGKCLCRAMRICSKIPIMNSNSLLYMYEDCRKFIPTLVTRNFCTGQIMRRIMQKVKIQAAQDVQVNLPQCNSPDNTLKYQFLSAFKEKGIRRLTCLHINLYYRYMHWKTTTVNMQ